MPPVFFPQALTFKAANAVILASLAKAAYGKFDEAKAAAAAYGLTAFEWISVAPPSPFSTATVSCGGRDQILNRADEFLKEMNI